MHITTRPLQDPRSDTEPLQGPLIAMDVHCIDPTMIRALIHALMLYARAWLLVRISAPFPIQAKPKGAQSSRRPSTRVDDDRGEEAVAGKMRGRKPANDPTTVDQPKPQGSTVQGPHEGKHSNTNQGTPPKQRPANTPASNPVPEHSPQILKIFPSRPLFLNFSQKFGGLGSL